MLQQMYPQVQHDYNYELNKDFQFAAAHFVPHEGAGACKFTHGHTYFVNVTVAGDQLDEQGFLTNFSTIKKLIHGRYDHSHMNAQDEFTADFDGNPEEFPTTENVARTIYNIVDQHLAQEDNNAWCLQVYVRETPTSSITYRPKKQDTIKRDMQESVHKALESVMAEIDKRKEKAVYLHRVTPKQYAALYNYALENPEVDEDGE